MKRRTAVGKKRYVLSIAKSWFALSCLSLSAPMGSPVYAELPWWQWNGYPPELSKLPLGYPDIRQDKLHLNVGHLGEFLKNVRKDQGSDPSDPLSCPWPWEDMSIVNRLKGMAKQEQG